MGPAEDTRPDEVESRAADHVPSAARSAVHLALDLPVAPAGAVRDEHGVAVPTQARDEDAGGREGLWPGRAPCRGQRQLDRALVLADSGIAATAGVPTPAPMLAQLLVARGYVLARARRAPDARRVLAEVRRLGGASDDPARAPAYLEAVVYAGLGESDSALDVLGRVFSGARDMNTTLAMLDPALRDVRRDARFVAMVRARGYGTGRP